MFIIAQFIQEHKWALIVGVVLGLVLGLVIGWGIWPVQSGNASPGHLRSDFQEYYLLWLADQVAIIRDQAWVRERLGVEYWEEGVLVETLENLAVKHGGAEAVHLRALKELAEAPTPAPTGEPEEAEPATGGGLWGSVATICGVTMVVLACVWAVVYLIRRIAARRAAPTNQYGGDNEMKKKNYLPLVWFVLGFGIFMSTRASNFIPHWGAAIIIAPIFILSFIRSQPTRKGILLTLLGFILSLNIAMWGLFTTGDPTTTIIYNLVRNSVLAILFSIPYIADRLIYPKIKANQFLATLAFPIAVTAIRFLISLEGPFDGDMVSAVYGYGNLGFKQIASIAGLWGFVFIFSWFASVVNFAWENGFSWGQIKTVTLAFAFTLLAIFLFGAVKTSALMNPESDTVKVAAIFLLPEEEKGFDPDGLFSKELSHYEKTMSRIEALTEEAASNGAKIVAFQENALKIHESDEASLLDRSKAIARENGVYLSLGYGLLFTEGKGWNKNILISDQGELVVDYRKRFLLGIGELGETAIYNKGPEVIQSADTPYGRIGVSICRDMSFSGYARQGGEQQVDVMLNPSFDYPKSTGAMYSLRAIENGFTMIRPVYNGFSYAVDPNGKLLASMDSDNTNTGIMYADVPTQGVNTIYAKIGDLLGWICVIGFLGLIPLNIVLRVKQKKEMG